MLPTRRSASARFTLIELLVVVSIIAILAAMLLPAITKARDKGNAAVCMNNLKQIGLAFFLYAEEFDGLFPPRDMAWPDRANIPENSWKRVCILPFLENNKTFFICPANYGSGIPSRDPNMPTSYACNGATGPPLTDRFCGLGSRTPMDTGFKQVSMVEEPSQLWQITENGEWPASSSLRDGGGRNEVILYPEFDDVRWSERQALYPLHVGIRGNYLFFDSHVELLKPSATAAGINMWGLNRQNEPGTPDMQRRMTILEAYRRSTM